VRGRRGLDRRGCVSPKPLFNLVRICHDHRFPISPELGRPRGGGRNVSYFREAVLPFSRVKKKNGLDLMFERAKIRARAKPSICFWPSIGKTLARVLWFVFGFGRV